MVVRLIIPPSYLGRAVVESSILRAALAPPWLLSPRSNGLCSRQSRLPPLHRFNPYPAFASFSMLCTRQ